MEPMLHASQPHVAPTLRNGSIRTASRPTYPGRMARPTPSSRSASEPTGPGVGNHYGQRLGLPASGSRSLAGTGRRALALLVDWLLAYGLAGLAIPFGLMSIDTLRYSWVGPTVIMAIWMALGAVSVRLFTFTPGQYALGLMVISVDGRTQTSASGGRWSEWC